ncbi:MAG: MBL fold metallo-hydrolase [Nanoarchaeota archaeon]|nr:MBL fold metallo-hydrolase [Nanoarchaeota archaeon]
MVSITALGGFSEIGKMGILLDTDKARFVFDYGLDVKTMEGPLPVGDIDGIMLSHAHLDHCGMIPLLYHRGFRGKTFLTPATGDLAELLLIDSLKVQDRRGLTPQFLRHDIDQLLHSYTQLHYEKSMNVPHGKLTLFDAGHIPGSSATLLETEDRRIMYTGDIKFSETGLLAGAAIPKTDLDILITEATYSYKNHPPREQLGNELREYVTDIIAKGGIALIPCFAVGRTQELLLQLDRLQIPVTIDGMGITASRIIMDHPEAIKDRKHLRKAFSRARIIEEPRQRRHALREPGVILSTSGMMQGGPSHYYMKHLHKHEKNAVILNGFQVEATPGHVLLETGRYVNEGIDVKPKCDVQFMDFSAHCDRAELLAFFERMRPKKIIVGHSANAEGFAAELQKDGYNATSLKDGSTITV